MSSFINKFKATFRPSLLQERLLRIALKGKNVECVCCGEKFITFLPAGIQKRANSRCVKCGSLERNRTLWLFLKERNELFSNPVKLLHVAPEKQYYPWFAKLSNIDYHPIDLYPEAYNYGSKTTKMDVTKMTYEDNFFDAIICSHVLEHVPDDAKAMSEMFRVLKPKGWAIINVPVNYSMEKTFEDPFINDPKKQLELFGQPDHVRVYGKDYFDRLRNAGFNVDVIDYPKKFSHNEQFKYGMKPSELIFYCTK